MKDHVSQKATDMEINLECRRCGCTFSQKLGDMPHGKVLKCPFCSGTSINFVDSPRFEDFGLELRESRFGKNLKNAR